MGTPSQYMESHWVCVIHDGGPSSALTVLDTVVPLRIRVAIDVAGCPDVPNSGLYWKYTGQGGGG